MFRLQPTDEEQAKEAAKFAVDHSAGAIWVVEDVVTNFVYSNYLAQEFVKQVQLEMKPSKVLLWTTNREVPFPEAVKALGINWVFFAGSWSNGVILIRQVKEIWKDKPNKPTVLLSASCAHPELLKEGGADMKGAYLIDPMPASQFLKEGFGHWGIRASQLSIDLIQDANDNFEDLSREKGGLWSTLRGFVGVHWVADARNALRTLMEHAVNDPEEHFYYLDGQKYSFKRDGTGTNPAFYMWRVSNDIKFTDIAAVAANNAGE